MKAVTQLVALSMLAVSSIGVAALAGCSAPTAPSSTLDDGSNPADNGGSAASAKVPPKQSTSTSNGSTSSPPAATTPPASTATTPPPSSTAPPAPTATATPGGDPKACMDQCAAGGVAAQYWTCSAMCHDQACDDTCWNASCAANGQACVSALDTCAMQCGLPPGG
jgi:hypothetical protein